MFKINSAADRIWYMNFIGKRIQLKNNNSALGSILHLILVGIIVGSAFYLLYPYWPKIYYYINRPDPNILAYPISYIPAETMVQGVSLVHKEWPKENRLVIPKIGVDTQIWDANSLDILDVKEGVWREPNSATPIVPGNMVVAGHRFQYLPPNTNTFYNLEEMKEGDKVYVFWDKRLYIYNIYQTEIVNPDQIDIRNPNANYLREITLYTCTPLYTSQRRFVVKANLETYSDVPTDIGQL